jgi:hypothetical protein
MKSLTLGLSLPMWFCLAAHGQTHGQTTEPTPRWPDGRVNLGSDPEHKGYWEIRPGRVGGYASIGEFFRAADVPFQPWARALFQYREAGKRDSPLADCVPATGPSFLNAPGFEIVDVPELKSIFILNIAGPHSWRVIYMDGRPHPGGDDLTSAFPDHTFPDHTFPGHTFLGHSIGHWEGDTLVVDSVGFNEKQWPVGGFPTTEQLHLTERFSRPNLKTLTYEVTIDDPGAYTKPWSSQWTITEETSSRWNPGEMFEYICEDAGR